MKTKIGQELWEVEWCSQLAYDQGGDLRPDGCTYSVRRLPTKNQAESFARHIYPQDRLGSVRITPVRAVDQLGMGRVTGYEASGLSEFYEGETERPL
jgi:hypothetical protein